MRVVAGSARGLRLVAPDGSSTRPTADRVREAVCNALDSVVGLEGATVLDAFAGSGAFGIETLSRGAAHATFVEPDRRARRAVTANLQSTRLIDRADLRADRIEDFCASHPDTEPAFDIALCDPPYAYDGWDELFAVLPAQLVVAESDRAVAPPPGWDVVRERRYGSTFVVFASRRADSTEEP